MKDSNTLSLKGYVEYPEAEMVQRSAQFLKNMAARRTVRDFSDQPVNREIIENCIKAAATAPSGANCQPWHFQWYRIRQSKPGFEGKLKKQRPGFMPVNPHKNG